MKIQVQKNYELVCIDCLYCCIAPLCMAFTITNFIKKFENCYEFRKNT